MAIHLGRLSPGASRDLPGRRRGNPPGKSLPPLLGLAPGGVCPAAPVAGGAVRSYRTLSPLPAAAPGGSEILDSNEIGARRPVSRVLSPAFLRRGWMAIHLGRPLPDASRDLPGRRRGNPPGPQVLRPGQPAVPTWSCSRWGLPCHPRRRGRGALLPHPFTLACRRADGALAGGLLSVALSLGSPPPGVTRHRVPVEPGLSSPGAGPNPTPTAAIRPSG